MTGAGGFIGSHLAEALLQQQVTVVGVDSFTDYYDPALKRARWAVLSRHPRFHPLAADILRVDWKRVLLRVDRVFHLAGQPGVRGSFGTGFQAYLDNNIAATARLLQACREAGVERFVNASSSSVYGRVPLPAAEDGPTRPYSPYGVSKHAAEQLVRVAWENFGLSAVSLRFFTVYGPGQRPDMAFDRFLRAIAAGRPLTLFGTGAQTRDFTYVGDIVASLLLAADHAPAGSVYNVGGGHRVSLREVIAMMEEILGKTADLRFAPPQPGDVADTAADVRRIQHDLGWSPATPLIDGLRRQTQSLGSREAVR